MTVVDLSVSLLGVLAVLPAVLVLAERRAARARGARPAPAPTRPSGVKSGWLIGAVAVVVLAYITSNTLQRRASRAGAGRGAAAGSRCRRGDARRADARTSGRRRVPVHGPGRVINVCGSPSAGPVVLAFVVTGAGGVRGPARRARPGRAALPPASLRRRRRARRPDDVRELARGGRRCPRRHDHDGAAAIRYGLGAVCPLSRSPGATAASRARARGVLDEAELTASASAACRERRCGRGRPVQPGGASTAQARAGIPMDAVAIDPRVAAEHPGLARVDRAVAGAGGAHAARAARPAALRRRPLRGPEAVALRSRPVPWAYRVLFRHLGLDPDVTRTPLEALVSTGCCTAASAHGMPEDALALATLETGVPVWAADADRTGPLRPAPLRRDGRLALPTTAGRSRCCSSRRCPAGTDARHAPAAAHRGAGAGRRGHLRRGGLWTAAAAMPTIDASRHDPARFYRARARRSAAFAAPAAAQETPASSTAR